MNAKSGFLLSDRERAVLTALCDAFHPRLTPEPGDDERLFAASSAEFGVPAAAEKWIGALATAQQDELRQLLRLLDYRGVGLLLGGVPRGASTMTLAERIRLLQRLSTSRIPQLRSGFQAVRRLSSFLMYAVSDAGGANRLWPVIGYQPSRLPPAIPATLRLTTIDTATMIDADVCIVGSGAGGGVAAATLAAKGLRVVVLEAGPGDQAPDFQQRELSGTQRLYLDSGLTATRDLGVSILAGACLGGGTAVNWQTSLRTPDAVRDEWTERSGSEMFTSDRFSRALDAVWSRSSASVRESAVNGNNAPLQRGCSVLGYSWETIHRNASDCDTTQCGYCTFGCRLGGKQATTVTYLHDAQLQGDTTIVARCSARQVTTANGRATGVRALVRNEAGQALELIVRSPRVVVAAGGIQSPALLLRSGVALPQLGRNLYLHPTSAVAGVYADRIEPWTGPPQTIVSNHFATYDGNYGFRLETAPVHPGLLALALPWTSPVQHRRHMQRAAHASAIIALARDSIGGRVRVRRDGSAVTDYLPGRAEQARITTGIIAAARVHLAAGAEEVVMLHARGLTFRRAASTTGGDIEAFCERVASERLDRNWSLVFSAHQMGTCGIGRDARSAVCDERGEVFGVRGLFVCDASAFPLSSGVNPMITVLALATCIAEGIE